MLTVRASVPATADESLDSTLSDLQQRIEILSSLIRKKNKVIEELKLQLEHNNKDLDHLATKAQQSEKALELEKRTYQTGIQKIKDNYRQFKEKHQELQEEQRQKTASEIEKLQDMIMNLQRSALAKEHQNIHLTMTIEELARLARLETQALRRKLEETKKFFLQHQEGNLKKLAGKLNKIIQTEALYKNTIQKLSERLLDKNKKLRILKPATRQLLLDQNNNQALIEELRAKLENEHARFEIQAEKLQENETALRTALEQVTLEQRITAKDLQEKNKETIAAYLENAYLKYQLQELRNEKHQADRRLLSSWKKWLVGGLATSAATLAGFILGTLFFATTFWNPAGWTLFALGAGLSGFCFYQAKRNHALAESIKKQSPLSTTAQLANSLGGEEGLTLTIRQPQPLASSSPPSQATPTLISPQTQPNLERATMIFRCKR